jgi:gamma-glutamylcyclotransferase (GGCT)/AIG2-like uncharacterized protein YtfP
MDKLVFVYGTLKQSHGNHRVLGDSEYVGEARLEGDYRMVSLGGFPGVVEDEDFRPVFGEVYRVTSEDVAHALDRLEGYHEGDPSSSFYQRVDGSVSMGNSSVGVELYVLGSSYANHPRVDSGVW